MNNRPNLLYIHSDQHNPFVTGCYGDPLVRTPNLDRLAASGAIFEQAYCASPICVPARMSMLTARHPYRNEVWTNEHVLNASIPTLAHSMGAAGYNPILVGRMDARGPDQLHGYSQRLVGDHSPNHTGGTPPVDRGILDGASEPHRVSLEKAGAGMSGYQVHDEDVTTATVGLLKQWGEQKKSTEALPPFSLSVGFMLPHAPYVTTPELYDYYRKRIVLPQKEPATGMHPYLRAWQRYTEINEPPPADMVLRARAAYWGMVETLDGMIGRILTALEENDLAQNTIIIYTSDHGDMVGEHGLWWKHVFYEESVRVPLLVSWPGVIDAGQKCRHPINAVDVTATILDALDAPALPRADGQSFLGLISQQHPTPTWHDTVYSEYCMDQYTPGGPQRIWELKDGEPAICLQRMIRQDIAGEAWKLIYYHGEEPQLFNLSRDVHEKNDLAQDPASQLIRRQLMVQLLTDWDPEAIRQTLINKQADTAILRAWAETTQPNEQYRWPLQPEMNWLRDYSKKDADINDTNRST